MHFCPHCGNMLQLENLHCVSFFCQTCPYVHRIEKKVWRCLLEAAMRMFFISTSLQAQIELDILISRKGVDDVLGGAEAWKNADQADATCPRCSHHRAYYQQLQIRSADEPMTTFYKCVACGHRWRED